MLVPAVYRAIEKTVEHLAKHLVIHGSRWIAEKNDIHDSRDSFIEARAKLLVRSDLKGEENRKE